MNALETEEAGLLIEGAACDRWSLEHVANNGNDPQWYDAVATAETDMEGVQRGDPIECKACQVWIPNGDRRRRGRWWVGRDAHTQLLEAGGQYVVGVYESESAAIQRLAMVDVETIDASLEERWTRCGDRHHSDESAQLPWPQVFASGFDAGPEVSQR